MPTLVQKPYTDSNFAMWRRDGVGGVTFSGAGAWSLTNLGTGVTGSSNVPFATTWTELQAINDNSGTASYKCSRVPMAFDTSSIPDNNTVLSATLTLYFHSPTDVDFFQAQNFSDARVWPIRVVEGTYPFNGPLVPADFGSLVRTRLVGSGNAGDVVTISSSLRSVTITITDLSIINKTGPTRLYLIPNADYLLTAPAYNSSQLCLTMHNAQDIATPQRAPELTVVHQLISYPTIPAFV